MYRATSFRSPWEILRLSKSTCLGLRQSHLLSRNPRTLLGPPWVEFSLILFHLLRSGFTWWCFPAGFRTAMLPFRSQRGFFGPALVALPRFSVSPYCYKNKVKCCNVTPFLCPRCTAYATPAQNKTAQVQSSPERPPQCTSERCEFAGIRLDR